MRGRKNDALRTVSMYGLAMYDALLYLDAYPYNEEAKKYFAEMTENERCAVAEYEKTTVRSLLRQVWKIKDGSGRRDRGRGRTVKEGCNYVVVCKKA